VIEVPANYSVTFVENAEYQCHTTDKASEMLTFVQYGLIVSDEVTIRKVKDD